MTTYPIEIDLTPHDPPTLRLRVVIGALVAGLALLLVLALATDTISFAADAVEHGRKVVRDGGTAARIAELDAEAGQ